MSSYEEMVRQIHDEEIRKLNYDTFISNVQNGYLENIKYMHNRIRNLEIEGTKWDKGFPFKVACAHGQLDVAKWIYSKIPEMDVSIDAEDPFRYACREGHLHIAKWLYEINPHIDASACFYRPFKNACNNGHLDVAKWLYYTFPEIKNELNRTPSFIRNELYGAETFPDVMDWLKLINSKSIKEIIYSQEVKRTSKTENCCICYETANIETSCGHFGCEDCFSLIADHNCPYCRQFITDYFKIVD